MKLWDKVQEDPIFMRKFNGWATIQWIGHFPVVIFIFFAFPETWISISLLYLALVSIYANVAGHLSAWQSARVEVKQEGAEAKMVKALVDKTDVELAPKEGAS